MEKVTVDYLIHRSRGETEKVARYIAFEQTVELPEELVTSPSIREEIVGHVDSIQPADGARDAFVATLSYNLRLSGLQLSQFLNLIYGNISIQPGIRLIGLRAPDKFLSRFRGPNYGIEGIRDLLGVYGRPLLATAIKPMGAPHPTLADIAGQFALGGGDIVKDDQNLVDDSTEAFRDRVSRCLEAVAEANAKTGRNTLYLPIISAGHGEIEGRIEFSLGKGARGILICPFLSGIDYTRHLAEKYRMVVMAHPSFAGTYFQDPRHGIIPGILLGQLMRLAGADISIYPNFGGRFSFTREECQDIGRRLRSPWARLKPAFPAPAGGMRFENLDAMGEDYGEDTVFLVGGALLGHSSSVEGSTKAFLSRIRDRFTESTPARATEIRS